jgi:hypothetical protein
MSILPTSALVTLFREPLINSESFSCAGKIRQIEAPIAGNSQPIAKIGNAELAYFNKQMLIHELIRGSLVSVTVYSSNNVPCLAIIPDLSSAAQAAKYQI